MVKVTSKKERYFHTPLQFSRLQLLSLISIALIVGLWNPTTGLVAAALITCCIMIFAKPAAPANNEFDAFSLSFLKPSQITKHQLENLDLAKYELMKQHTTMQTILADIVRPADILIKEANKLRELSDAILFSSQHLTSEVEQACAYSIEISQKCTKNNKDIAAVHTLATQTAEEATEHQSVVNEVYQVMAAINGKVSVIDDIASKTHILSINAAIEARSAGKAGNGFAVVAHEVRNLADKAKTAAFDISDIVKSNTQLSESTKTRFEEMREMISQVSLLLDDLTAISTELDTKATSISASMESIAEDGMKNVTQSLALSKAANAIRHHASELNVSSTYLNSWVD